MGDTAPADPERFKEASDWFRSRLAVTRDQWDTMTAEARQQAFTLAGTAQLEVVQTVMASLQDAIDKGTPIDKWRADIAEKLGQRFTDHHATTLTTAFINANQTAYNTGRWYQLQDQAVASAMPFLVFSAVLDNVTSECCQECNGTVLRNTDAWWLTHFPPLHHRCRSTVRALTARQAERSGISDAGPLPNVAGSFGLAPPLRADWKPDLSKYESHAAREYEKKQQSLKSRERRRFRKKDVAPPEPPSTRLGEVAEKVFGKKISDRELDALFGLNAKLPKGFSLSISDVSENARKESVRVIGAIKNDQGHVVGNISRSFIRKDGITTVEHSTFYINSSLQGSGIGRAVFNAQIEAYKSTGLVKNVTLDAAETGRYVWTKAGFEWSADDKAALLGTLRDKLLTKVGADAADAILAEVKTPFDVARVVVDGDRVGKELLMNYQTDIISMSQTPDKITPL